MQNERCIIIGSGNSLSEGISLDIWNFLSKEITFGINETIKFFDSTIAMVGDWTCYKDRYEYFNKHSLVISRWQSQYGKIVDNKLICPKSDNLILLPYSGKFHTDNALTKGLYGGILTGAFALSLAIALGYKQIFLLGFDNVEINGKTHWYQDIPNTGYFHDFNGDFQTGIGKNTINLYNTDIYNNSDKELNTFWQPFTQVKNIKIVNVSPLSRISTFDKIDYKVFIEYLKTYPIDIKQDIVRNEIQSILQPYNLANV